MKAPVPLEFGEHCAIADALRIALAPGWVWFHPANGEKRSKLDGARLQAMGVRPGVSDFILAAPPTGRMHALELKRRHQQPTDKQAAFLRAVEACGGEAAWVDSAADGIELLRRWGAISTRLRVTA